MHSLRPGALQQLLNSSLGSSLRVASRSIYHSTPLLTDEKKAGGGEAPAPASQGWISRILGGSPVNPDMMQKQSHSSLLSDTEMIYGLTTHDTKCGEMDNYLKIYEQYAKTCTSASPGMELVGSWTVLFANQDQAVHLWRYKAGFQDVDQSVDALKTNQTLRSAEHEVALLCRKRSSVLTKSFSYWGDPKPRPSKHVYDLRSYVLKPGTMIEWGNSWAKGITYRREHNQDVGGFFAQVGQLYVVFHLWAYTDLVSRKSTREHNWSKPGWDTTVAYTVPLIKEMESKIMTPTSFSQLK